ncbi:AAA family ATPase [Mycobacterium xenopi]|uniref:AAA family ATPase n=1 Tax=Mycobacterium xenopi TaxID=1789 RepID=UPI0022EB4CB2|nr:AAA family ATPase [Mycobacterium xenopi]MDA3641388.1 AAA family ATPase [Mycobacterium xenopi]MDA3659418.1 AAA family ATPase [Mycobacterium xenopi]MDA3664724.1 AAA family ATPase [Mycobacterium xenopi]
MKLHRLVLTNYRGIAHREVEFPDSGVVVVCGPNEIGKSSMIEALDLLLESKDRSTKKDVKQVKPTHADVGSEVTAEISTGPYRFVYHKRFHKKCETQLTVLAPHREQLTGDEAHERVRAMLAETVDTELWHAQRVLQATSTTAVDLSGCDALSRALDVAAGDASALSGTEPSLIERIDAEYARYFTPTGRPTGEWATAISRLHEAEQEVARCAAAVAEVDERVRRHAALTDELAELSRRQQDTEARHRAAQAAAARITKLTEQLREARLIATAAAATRAASNAAHSERLRLRAEIDARTAAIASLETELRQAIDAQSTAREAVAAADAAAEQAGGELAAARRRVDTARHALEKMSERAEANRLTAQLAKIEAAQRDRDRICAELALLPVTEAVMHRIEDAAAAVERAKSRLETVSATLEFIAVVDIELEAGGQRVALPAGQSWSTTASGPTEIAVPGVLTARFTPGATARDIEAEYAAAQSELADALAAGQVADLAAARRADARRRELQNHRDQLTARLSALCGDGDVDQLRARLAQVRGSHPDGPADVVDADAARAEVGAADAAHAQAAARCDECREAAATAASRAVEISTRVMLLQDKLAAQRAELDAICARLAQSSDTDEDLAVTADSDRRVAEAADQRVSDLSEQLKAAAPDVVAAELADAAAAAEGVRARRDETARVLHEITVELAVFGTEGRKGKLDAAETRREHAAAEYSRVSRRARAAELLRSVMIRHRDTMRSRYVEPFRTELQRLGRPVFGPSFEVDVDNELNIRSRTLDGRTVPYESLSGGAKEQLGILVRLAGAALVAKEDTVPVLIDDALGFTDPDRLAKMGEVFDMVGADGQLIVLTCTPARYDGVHSAHRIDLSGPQRLSPV